MDMKKSCPLGPPLGTEDVHVPLTDLKLSCQPGINLLNLAQYYNAFHSHSSEADIHNLQNAASWRLK